MDIILELTDTYVWDYMYAYLLPARPAPYDFPDVKSNATGQTFSSWQYKPATKMFSFEPSQAAYMSSLPRDNIYREAVSLFFITWIFGIVLYFVFGTLSYVFVFDKETKKHPKYLKNQIALEMIQANTSMPGIALCTVPFFLAEVRGYSFLYDTSAEGPGWWYDILQFPLFLFFTDCCIYWIHRGLHHPLVYKRLHKPHHKWIMPTPYASHAFHFLDGFAQGVPYHVFVFLFPLQKWAYIVLFVFINFWTILIHDGEFYSNNPVVNGAACHSVHHLAFNYNYGQFFTLWDRIGGSYRAPDQSLFKKETKMSEDLWTKQVKEMETIVKDVEGSDDREYGPTDSPKVKKASKVSKKESKKSR